MKKGFRKIGAVLLTFAMALAMNSTVFAAASLTGGEVGGFTNPDAPVSQEKTINIQKELTVYNVNETTINAPTISYTYAITAGAAGVSVTDATSDHANNTAVTVQTKAGVGVSDITLTGTSANTIAWASTGTVTADTDGAANYKNLEIDFSNVVFGAAGVYRYVITETPPAYAASGVTETTSTTNPHVRYLDVYVRPAATFTDGSIADDWDIYGYVCMLESEAITPDGDTTTTGAVKTNGFVAGTNDGAAYLADSYYTYNVTVSKTVTNDNYAKATHAFPFTVIFTNATVTNAVDISSTTTGTVGGFTDPASAALSAGNTKGILTLKDSSSVKYIGIPNGTQIEVYETNDMAGVTYQVTTTVDGTTSTADDTVDVAVISGTAPTTAVAQGSPKGNYESTKASFTPGANADDDVAHTIAVDNNLQLISPTGFVVRFAPYMLVLLGGILLITIGLVIYNKTNKKETA
ncbi:MAG: hypothetical protein IKS60_01790 [Lachnospiraceae bacterium]|nr:hypothetical protein [Lachnospiraceae bacterium]MBR4412322.1 hypothetical protein [Lachnospiraceae bacterium]MBR5066915.1 hypothetical protein [Lachnospiraceae bacterium]MBR5918092.1 hypothetical protein [Lachnospiraceae bacterium]